MLTTTKYVQIIQGKKKLRKTNDILKQHQEILKKYQMELVELKNTIIELKYLKIETIKFDLPKISHLLCAEPRTQAVLGKNDACDLFTLLYLNGQMK